MAEELTFKDLIRRIRLGDNDAAAEVVRRYEPAIRRTVRVHLVDPSLERLLDSMDICQSVLGSFFVRMNLGQFEVESPRQLLRLLEAMTRNKLNDQARRLGAARRDVHLLRQADGERLDDIPGSGTSPSRALLARELLEQVRARLSAEEWFLAEQRTLGREWADLGLELGRTPESLRKQLERACQRVLRELGLDDDA
jgi:RNA polymerase sigma-70 factor (ECF subfamily)